MEAIAFGGQKSCLYLYAIVDSHAASPEKEKAGISFIAFRDIACAAATVPTSEYVRDLPSDAPQLLDWIAPRVMEHHRILLDMMLRSTIVPFKFGTLCASAGDVQTMLQQQYERFRILLDQLRGKEEWVVSIDVDRPTLVRRLESTEEQLKEFNLLIAEKDGGEAYLLRKKKDKVAESLLKDVLGRMQEECHQRLQCLSHAPIEARPSSLSNGRIQVLTATVLFPETGFGLLQEAASEIETDYAKYSTSVRLSGPWPAYSVVSRESFDST